MMTIILAIAGSVAAALCVLFIHSFLLSLAHRAQRAWVRLYTHRLSLELRDARTEDVAAFYGDWEADQQTQGYKPEQIGARLFGYIMAGAKGDIAWRWDADLGPRIMPPLRWMWRWRHSGLVLKNVSRFWTVQWLGLGLTELVIGPLSPSLRAALVIALFGAVCHAVVALVRDIRIARILYHLRLYPLDPGEDDGGLLETIIDIAGRRRVRLRDAW